MIKESFQARALHQISNVLKLVFETFPLLILCAIFGLFDVPANPFQDVAIWFVYASIGDWHMFNLVIGIVFVVGLGALHGTDWRRKRSYIALLIGVPAVTMTALAVAALDKPSLTPAALALGVAASSAFWALGSNRHRTH
jgi:riboflavin transporter FmnP